MIIASRLFEIYSILLIGGVLLFLFILFKDIILKIVVEEEQVVFYSILRFRKKKKCFLRESIQAELIKEVTFRGGVEQIIDIKNKKTGRILYRLKDKSFSEQNFTKIKQIFLTD